MASIPASAQWCVCCCCSCCPRRRAMCPLPLPSTSARRGIVVVSVFYPVSVVMLKRHAPAPWAQMRGAFGAADATLGKSARDALNPAGRASRERDEAPAMSEMDRKLWKEIAAELEAADVADKERTARLRGERA